VDVELDGGFALRHAEDGLDEEEEEEAVTEEGIITGGGAFTVGSLALTGRTLYAFD
jgi:hypothetical protein